MNILEYLWDLLFPPKCLLCRNVLNRDELDLCHECRTHGPDCTVRRKKFPFIDSWVAIWYYDDENVRRSLLRYKFCGVRSYAIGYGRLLAMQIIQDHSEGFDLLK